MARKRQNRIAVHKGMMHTRYYENQLQVAEDFGIKSSDKKSLERYAKKFDWEIEWNE